MICGSMPDMTENNLGNINSGDEVAIVLDGCCPAKWH